MEIIEKIEKIRMDRQMKETNEWVLTDAMDPQEKIDVARLILEDLPEWFGIESARNEYIQQAADQRVWSCKIKEQPLGFISLKRTGNATGEVAVVGVSKEMHRKRIGAALLAALEEGAREEGMEFLQVKTVKLGTDPNYDRTNLFYQRQGFMEFECFPELWDPGNPCQIYIKSLIKN